jgi:hypothetical protein
MLIVPGPSRSQIACSATGSSRAANPLDSAVKAIPARAAWRLTHSCPLTHYAAARIMCCRLGLPGWRAFQVVRGLLMLSA